MINAIFATDLSGGIGYNGGLPWPHNPRDMQHFRNRTLGDVVVMGRRTWDDPAMPKPLPGRITYVATNRPMSRSMTISGDLKERVLRLEQQHAGRNIWIIGGNELIQQCSSILDRIYLTHVSGSYKIDTKVHLASLLSAFVPVSATHDPVHHCTFITYETVFKRIKTST